MQKIFYITPDLILKKESYSRFFDKIGSMYPRFYKLSKSQSFFLFGARGTGKSTWLKQSFGQAHWVDLLDEGLYQRLLRNPQHFYEQMLPLKSGAWIVVDEIQRAPFILNYVHKLIEEKKLKFALTGSSARKLKRENANMLAGRALTRRFYPLTARELGHHFDLKRSLQTGHLPFAYQTENPEAYLQSYIGTYLREEVQQEALVRNISSFSYFLESLSFSQGAVINSQAIARDVGVDRKTIDSYIGLVEDLLIGRRLPVFQKRAKRKLTTKPKFYFFDVGVYRALRPQGPLDHPEEIDGVALETLVLQELAAFLEQEELQIEIFFFRTQTHKEVDFVLYGRDGFSAIEVKRSNRIRDEDLEGLRLFHADYPKAKCVLLYGGESDRLIDGFIHVFPLQTALLGLHRVL